ncbi:chemotaxis protein CheW [Lysobacter soli]|uniref:Chemotaxis protein CheW n=1 Tax=Lysobacter soli TaxID=453783 RepID=A0A3D8V7X0_9GAMM|nr:chemotaxis protein CheW [Lysobacter soli]RDY65373.1 chemotaxis protein CheW [Lysobacter soli]
MNHPALDAYLDELLDLNVDAVAPAPVAANAPVMGAVDEPAPDPLDADIPAPVALPPGIDANLLAELDSDPLFAAQQPEASEAPLIDAGLLAELDNDPLFAALPPAVANDVAPAMPQIDPGLLAELDSDPLFAAMLASNETSTPDIPGIDPGLLAELESDPLFASQSAAEEKPLPLHAGGGWEGVRGAQAPGPEVSRAVDFTPPQPSPAGRGGSNSPRNAMPPAEARGLRPVEVTPPALMPTVTTTHRWLRVAVGEDSYAVELLRVQEVGRTVPIVAMRGAAPSVLGAMNLRGRIVPVFDLGLWLGTGRVTPDERARIVVVERDNELIGALVSAVDDVVTLGPDRIEPPLMASPSRAIVGVARVVAKPTVLLDANALFG